MTTNENQMKVYNMKDYGRNVPETDTAVYIGRPSKWGNPFTIGRDGTREEVIKQYEEYFLSNIPLQEQIHELKGKDLVCWCAPLACHGDILLKYANPIRRTK